jgi:hypothetical protein
MSDPDDRGGIFRSPGGPAAEQPDQPVVDGSTEAMRRLRHPFDVEPAPGTEDRTGPGS